MKNMLPHSLLSSFLLFVWFAGCSQQPADLPVKEFEQKAEQPGVQLLDVRTSGEYKSGHLENALQADWTNQDEFKYRIQGLDKSKPVYVYCLSGGRSGAAANYLRDKGFTVYNMQGGIKAWKMADLPLKEPAAVKQITTGEYNNMIAGNNTVLVDFGAEWCPPCKKMNPLIDSLSKAGNLNFKLVKVDGGDQVDVSKAVKVDALPTFIVYKNGKEVWRKTGIIEAAELVQQLQ